MFAANVIYTLIIISKFKFIAYIYICFHQNLDEKSYISAKIIALKHLTVEQRQRSFRLVKAMVYFDVIDVAAWLDVVTGLQIRLRSNG